ncbi:MAG: hypothetical protein KDA75_17490, partial [Planctomycetaceae bacterium]|nr:hypothetical protein [Planctomycetaceae bacterium]
MVSRTLKVLTLVSSLAIAGSASSADACCWLFGGGGWGAYRPLSWGSGYSGGCGSCGYSGLGYGGYGCGSCGTGSCGYGGCGSCGYGGYGYGGCGSCGTGACGVQSLYGPACDTCGGGGCSSCAGYCGTSNYLSSSDCCTPAGASTEPTPDSNASSPGTDNFRGAPASGMPRSSIPDNSNRSS